MAEFASVTDVEVRGLGRLLEQYKRLPNIETLTAIYLQAVQELEDVTAEVVLKRFLANATGDQLRVLGDIVGQQNVEGWTEDQYRTWIAVRIRLNRSFGTPVDVIDCIRLATPAVFKLREYVSGAFMIMFQEAPEFPNDVQAIAYLARAAGVNVTVLYPGPDGPGFRFKNVGDADDPAKGFADVS